MAEAGNREPLLTDDIRELLRLIADGDIAEVLIRRGDAEVHVKRAAAQPHVVSVVAPGAASAAIPTPVYVPAPAAAIAPAEDVPEAVAQVPGGTVVTAPMVGTFYNAPSPKDPPYVQAGDEVRPGDVLGIIEAMKIMNEIECEIQGRVVEVLVSNGQAVEYGQPLMVIDPA
jgi:acetyl-CoA carboxylase biotin carboxyl carrier protein